ncbi:MAG TPA: hypothetical protein VGA08_03650 [Candidatus Saccharimonadales bacterium]
MTEETNNRKDLDFFELLNESDDGVSDPFGEQQIFVKDETGIMRLVGGQPAIASPARVAVKTPVTPTGEPLNVTEDVDAVIRRSELKITDPLAQTRLERIIEARFRGVRNSIQTREILIDSPLVGGLGLEPAQADQLLRLINEQAGSLHDRHRQTMTRQDFADLRAEAEQLLSGSGVKPTEPPVLKFPAKDSEPQALPSHVRAESRPGTSRPISPAVVSQSKPSQPPVAPKIAQRPLTPLAPNVGKPQRIQDVKFRPRLTGPAEELRSLTLEDFRHLAPEPLAAAEKILEKIDLLEQDSFAKRVEGIKAWKESSLNRLYLKLGDQSMESKKSIAELIAQSPTTAQPTLTSEEFDAIMDLNSSLRY